MAVMRLFLLSKVAPTVAKGCDELPDSVAEARRCGDHRAFDVLMEAQYYWDMMGRFRRDRERNKRYCYGDQWGDMICVPDGAGGCERMTEEQYIAKQGSVPLKNNLIRRLVKSVLGVYRSQMKEPTCTARDRDEQKLGETMSTILQCNMQLNRMSELHARTMEEFLISGLAVHKKTFGWRNGKLDCWTDMVSPNNFFVDCNMQDVRTWDVGFIGEVHDVSFGHLCENFARSEEDLARLRRIYSFARRRDMIARTAEEFGYSKLSSYDFLFTNEEGRCRVVEVWRKEQKPRYRCHDYLNGDIYKIDLEDYGGLVEAANAERMEQARETGIPEDEVPLIRAEWFMDDYWYFYYLSPFGDILMEGETPYAHGGHPYVFKAYPFIDGEIHAFVADVIDQQRYTNRLITLYDWIMRASAKGVLLVPKDCIPDDMQLEDFAEAWTEFNGVIAYQPSTRHGQIPTQVANNSTNIGISELLSLQLSFFEDISGVHGALQGKTGFSGESAAHYNQQTQNATMTLLDLLESYSDFVCEGAYKDVKNIQQFYDQKRIFNIVGRQAVVEYDPDKISDVDFDLSIVESTTTPAYRQLANDILMQLWQANAISVEQLLEHGNFPFADELLQSIRSQWEQVEQGQVPQGVSPQLMRQAQQEADMQAVHTAQEAMRG